MTAQPSPLHILICDDDATTRLFLRRMAVQKLGWSFAEAADGAAALQLLDNERFDLAVLDINMPKVNGIAVLQSIRSSRNLRELPVVMLTADQREDVVRTLLGLGISGYLVKPLSMPVAVARFEQIAASLPPRPPVPGTAP